MRPDREEASGGIDWWPFTRFLITGTVLALAAHYHLGWMPEVGYWARLPRNVFEVLSLAALISFPLAELYLLLFLIPLYALAVLNDWFYDLSRWAVRTILQFRRNSLLALGGLCGEVVLFGAMAFLLRRLLLN